MTALALGWLRLCGLATRKRNKLAAKTIYEYGSYHSLFVEWLETRKKKKHIPVHSITRADLVDYIDELLDQGIGAKTISKNVWRRSAACLSLRRQRGLTRTALRGLRVLYRTRNVPSSIGTVLAMRYRREARLASAGSSLGSKPSGCLQVLTCFNERPTMRLQKLTFWKVQILVLPPPRRPLRADCKEMM